MNEQNSHMQSEYINSYTKILEVNLFAFAYRLFHRDFSPLNWASYIHRYSGITSGRVLDGELLYTKILEVNLFAFAYTDCFMKISVQSTGRCMVLILFSGFI